MSSSALRSVAGGFVRVGGDSALTTTHCLGTKLSRGSGSMRFVATMGGTLCSSPEGPSPLVGTVVGLYAPGEDNTGVGSMVACGFSSLIRRCLSGMGLRCGAVCGSRRRRSSSRLPVCRIRNFVSDEKSVRGSISLVFSRRTCRGICSRPCR